MTGEQFAATHAELDRIEKRLDHGFELLSTQLAKTKTDIIAVVSAFRDKDMDELKERVRRIEKKLGLAA